MVFETQEGMRVVPATFMWVAIILLQLWARVAAARARDSGTFCAQNATRAPRPSCVFCAACPLSRPPDVDQELYRKAYCLLQFTHTGTSSCSRRP